MLFSIFYSHLFLFKYSQFFLWPSAFCFRLFKWPQGALDRKPRQWNEENKCCWPDGPSTVSDLFGAARKLFHKLFSRQTTSFMDSREHPRRSQSKIKQKLRTLTLNMVLFLRSSDTDYVGSPLNRHCFEIHLHNKEGTTYNNTSGTAFRDHWIMENFSWKNWKIYTRTNGIYYSKI